MSLVFNTHTGAPSWLYDDLGVGRVMVKEKGKLKGPYPYYVDPIFEQRLSMAQVALCEHIAAMPAAVAVPVAVAVVAGLKRVIFIVMCYNVVCSDRKTRNVIRTQSRFYQTSTILKHSMVESQQRTQLGLSSCV